MSRYTTVESIIWHDEKFRSLPEDARMLFLYLLTSPHSNMLGIFYLPKLYACSDLQWEPERYQRGIDTLCDTLLIEVDKDIVWIKNYLKHNPIKGPKQITGAANRLMTLPDTKLIGPFMKNLEKHLLEDDLKLFKELYTKPYEYPSNTLSDTLCDTPSIADTDPDTDTVTGTGDIGTCAPDDAQDENGDLGGSVEAEKVTATPDGDKPSSKSRPRSPFKSGRQEQLFDEFWAEYPKKRSKGQAEKTWVKLKPDEQLFEAIMTGLKRAKTSADWAKNGGQYIPYPSTWLNAKGWEDDYRPLEVINGGRSQKHRGYPQGEDDYSDLIIR